MNMDYWTGAVSLEGDTDAMVDALKQEAKFDDLVERGISEIETFLAGVFDNA